MCTLSICATKSHREMGRRIRKPKAQNRQRPQKPGHINFTTCDLTYVKHDRAKIKLSNSTKLYGLPLEPNRLGRCTRIFNVECHPYQTISFSLKMERQGSWQAGRQAGWPDSKVYVCVCGCICVSVCMIRGWFGRFVAFAVV